MKKRYRSGQLPSHHYDSFTFFISTWHLAGEPLRDGEKRGGNLGNGSYSRQKRRTRAETETRLILETRGAVNSKKFGRIKGKKERRRETRRGIREGGRWYKNGGERNCCYYEGIEGIEGREEELTGMEDGEGEEKKSTRRISGCREAEMAAGLWKIVNRLNSSAQPSRRNYLISSIISARVHFSCHYRDAVSIYDLGSLERGAYTRAWSSIAIKSSARGPARAVRKVIFFPLVATRHLSLSLPFHATNTRDQSFRSPLSDDQFQSIETSKIANILNNIPLYKIICKLLKKRKSWNGGGMEWNRKRIEHIPNSSKFQSVGNYGGLKGIEIRAAIAGVYDIQPVLGNRSKASLRSVS